MEPPPTIVRLEVEALDLPLHEPFGISGGAQAAANNVLVTVELSDGTLGFGEAAPLPPYNGETQREALEILAGATAWTRNRSVADWEAIGAELTRRAGSRSGSARCALEMALLDAMTRSRGEPLWKFFGGRGTELETDMTITTGSAAQAGAAAKSIRERGIRIIKVKVGGQDHSAQDLARIDAIARMAPGAPLILDGNAGLSRGYAAELAQGLRQRKIEPLLLEQWLAKDDLAGMRALHEETGWTVAADESVVTANDVAALVRAGAAQAVNVKLMKAGIAEAGRVAEAASVAGLKLMIGGNVESILAMTASACFAAGRGGFAYGDLDTPLFLASNPFRGGFSLEGARISVGRIAAGHGVTPGR